MFCNKIKIFVKENKMTDVLSAVQDTLESRRAADPSESYTAQ